MGDYSTSRASFTQRGITLNHLRDELHALNMRMLLAMQLHNEPEQEALGTQMAALQREIEQIGGTRK